MVENGNFPPFGNFKESNRFQDLKPEEVMEGKIMDV